MDEIFKALADPSRRQLLDQLREKNGRRLSEMCSDLDMTRQAVSKHLKILENANLIVTVWSGREKYHFLNAVPIHQIAERWVAKYESHQLDAIGELKKALENKETK